MGSAKKEYPRGRISATICFRSNSSGMTSCRSSKLQFGKRSPRLSSSWNCSAHSGSSDFIKSNLVAPLLGQDSRLILELQGATDLRRYEQPVLQRCFWEYVQALAKSIQHAVSKKVLLNQTNQQESGRLHLYPFVASDPQPVSTSAGRPADYGRAHTRYRSSIRSG